MNTIISIKLHHFCQVTFRIGKKIQHYVLHGWYGSSSKLNKHNNIYHQEKTSGEIDGRWVPFNSCTLPSGIEYISMPHPLYHWFQPTVVWQVWIVALPLDKFILYRFDNFLDYKINFQGLDSLHDLNTLSSYKCTKLWRTQNKLTLNMHTCEWRIQELINVTLEFRAQNTWIFNPITKLDKLFQLAHSCHHYTSLKHLHWLFQLVRVS